MSGTEMTVENLSTEEKLDLILELIEGITETLEELKELVIDRGYVGDDAYVES
jgi:hypothetical protein